MFSSISILDDLKNTQKKETQSNVVLLTGGSRGIGLELLRSLVADGFKVATCSSTDKITVVTDEFQGNPSVIAKQINVQDMDKMKSYIEEIENTWGPINILINNAAITGPFKKQQDITEEEIEETQKINFKAPKELSNYFLRKWSKTTDTTPCIIINISSKVCDGEVQGAYAYSDSKCALNHFTKTIATENKKVKVFSIDPGATKTDMLIQITKADPEIFPFKLAIDQALLKNEIKSAKEAAELIKFVILHPNDFNIKGSMISPEEIYSHMKVDGLSTEKTKPNFSNTPSLLQNNNESFHQTIYSPLQIPLASPTLNIGGSGRAPLGSPISTLNVNNNVKKRKLSHQPQPFNDNDNSPYLMNAFTSYRLRKTHSYEEVGRSLCNYYLITPATHKSQPYEYKNNQIKSII